MDETSAQHDDRRDDGCPVAKRFDGSADQADAAGQPACEHLMSLPP
ncbi:MAG: hypothetical protein J5X22_10895 [Candidatus Accumulibacter sp.]|jgi:hypothetical protein|nr:hypothetical protein [Accumulibacter sp.]MBO3711001.1 hypothetical protein [Accumulibacter sp.]